LSLGEAFRTLRERRGLTLRDAGALIGCAHVTISNIERGRCNPSIELLAAAREAYGLDPYVLAAVSNGLDVREYAI
jgi:transcriptional regulator with XRE-family HTH domain